MVYIIFVLVMLDPSPCSFPTYSPNQPIFHPPSNHKISTKSRQKLSRAVYMEDTMNKGELYPIQLVGIGLCGK